MNRNYAVALALGAACAALLCLARRRQTETSNDADLNQQLHRIHEDIVLQRRLTLGARSVLNDTHKRLAAVTKALEKQAS